MPKRPVRIANFGGAMGDRFSALAEAVNGESVDVAVADYMAEITMGVVAAHHADNPDALSSFTLSYFQRQITPLLKSIAEKGLKVVVNAGVFDPATMAGQLAEEIKGQCLSLSVAHVLGDDILGRVDQLRGDGQLQHMDDGVPSTLETKDIMAANAYLGGWGIAAALEAGADIVVTGRVSDASLILGPAAWWHGWKRDEWDKLAGAVAAGHIIECGQQVTGGNFSGFTTIPNMVRVGFPIAEIAEDGSFVITKRADEGGAVTTDTVTAQLMYEIQGPRYLNPDVIWHTDSVILTQEGPDRVRVSDVKGSIPPVTTKVNMYSLNGYRWSMWLFATGVEIEEKKALYRDQLNTVAGNLDLDEFRIAFFGQPVIDPKTSEEAAVPLRVSAAAQTQAELQKLVAGIQGFMLGGVPGLYSEIGVSNMMARVEYWPGLVKQSELTHTVVFDDGRTLQVEGVPTATFAGQPERTVTGLAAVTGETRRAPLGDVVYARSGDKGANANLGVWSRTPEAREWVRHFFTAEKLHELIGADESVIVESYDMPNLGGVQFVIRNYFGRSGCANLDTDQIGKAVGEFVRARFADIPVELLS